MVIAASIKLVLYKSCSVLEIVIRRSNLVAYAKGRVSQVSHMYGTNKYMQGALFARIKSMIPWLLEPLQLLVVAQLAFLAIGIPYLDFNVGWFDVIVAVTTAVLVEFVATYVRTLYGGSSFRLFFPSSALAAALGISIFFRASSPLYFAFAALAAILSKHVIRLEGRHVFNPSNFGIVSLVLLAPFAATIEFTQWGNNPYAYAIVAIVSIGIAYRAAVLVTTISFMVSYTTLLILWLPLSPSLFSLHHYGLLGPSFVLFASFMISDPRTSPRGFYARIIHGTSIAFLYFSLEAGGVRYALFISSFGVSLLNAVLPFVLRSKIFSLFHTPRNIATGVVALLLCISGYVSLLRNHKTMPNVIQPSLSFILFGVEGSSILNCRIDSVFRASTRSGLEKSHSAIGAAWGDYNLDGFDDLFVSGYWAPSQLYRNNGDGTFTDVTKEAGVLKEGSTAAYFADYDNDGKQDLFVLAVRKATSAGATPQQLPFPIKKMRVYKNLGGSFSDVTEKLGLSDYETPFSAASASFADYDGNGTLDFIIADSGLRQDLFVGKNEALKKSLSDPYLAKSQVTACGRAADLILDAHPDVLSSVESLMGVDVFRARGGCLIVTSRISVGEGNTEHKWSAEAPVIDALIHIPGSARLYLNTGGRYVEWGAFRDTVNSVLKEGQESTELDSQGYGAHPYYRVSGAFFQPISFDYDGDGRMDVLLTSDFGSNLLLRNEPGMKFRDVTIPAGLDYYGSGMGVDVADYNEDGLADIFITNSLTDFVFRNNGNGTFSSSSEFLSLGSTGVGWGISLLDYDSDGHEDVFISNGDNLRTSLDPDPKLQRPLLRRDNLYRNLGKGTFADRSGIDMCSDTSTGFPLAVSDFDNDGDPDVFIGNSAIFGGTPESNMFLQNTSFHAGRYYISIILKGVKDNSFGIGSKVSVTSKDATQTKFVTLGESFYSQNSSTLLFGLGEDAQPVDIRVVWPSGTILERKGVDVNQIITISQ